MLLNYSRPNQPAKLRAAIVAAFPAATVEIADDDIAVTVPDGTDPAAVAAIVQAHNATTTATEDQQQATVAANDRTIRDRLEQALANLETANTNWATLTAAQKDAATRAAVRSAAGLIRLQLRRLDNTG